MQFLPRPMTTPVARRRGRGESFRLLVLPLAQPACTPFQQATRGMGQYELYRQSRIAKTPEARLRAAWSYLKAGYSGPARAATEAWFYPRERRLFAQSRASLEGISNYLSVLPDGPHRLAAQLRIGELLSEQQAEAKKSKQRSARDSTLLAELVKASDDRKHFVREFSSLVERMLSPRLFNISPSELPSQFKTIFRRSLSNALCSRERCSEHLDFRFSIPENRQQVVRNAPFSITLRLGPDGVAVVELGGPLLFSRLSEALSLEAVESDQGQARIEALARVISLVELLSEPRMPLESCGRPVESPEVLVRVCSGVKLSMVPSEGEEKDDRIVVSAAGSEPKRDAPSSSKPGFQSPRVPATP